MIAQAFDFWRSRLRLVIIVQANGLCLIFGTFHSEYNMNRSSLYKLCVCSQAVLNGGEEPTDHCSFSAVSVHCLFDRQALCVSLCLWKLALDCFAQMMLWLWLSLWWR